LIKIEYLRLLALFNLKDGVSEADYLAWAKRVDIPTVNGLRSIDNFQVYSVNGIFGSNDTPPYQYYEMISVNNMEGFTDDVFFLLSNEIS